MSVRSAESSGCPGRCSTGGGGESSTTASTGCTHAGPRGGGVGRSRSLRTPSAWCRAWRSVPGLGGAAGSPPIWPGRGTAMSRPAPSSDPAPRRTGDPPGRAWRCSSSKRSRRWGRSPNGPAAPVAGPARPDTARRGPSAGRARVSRHVLHRPAQGRRQGLADHGLRCLRLVRGGVAAAGLHAAAAATFLRTVVLPLFRKAGWSIQRVLTDGGRNSSAPSMRPVRRSASATPGRNPRMRGPMASSNGCRTILHEHWRVIFRRQYFTSRAVLHRTLDGFLRFYNHDRPHQGYRLRGHPPATVFWGAVHP